MWSFSWLQIGKKPPSGKHPRANRFPHPRAGFRPRLEDLEDRCLPSFTYAGFYPTGPSGPVVTPPLNHYAVVTADLNGDGILDLVSTNAFGGGAVSVLLATTSGKKGSTTSSFAPAQNYDIGSPFAIVVGDVNGDGKPDIVANNGSVLLNNGNGTFHNGPSIAGLAAFHIFLADVNGDGKLDLICDSAGTSEWLGNGDGSFRAGPGSGAGVVAVGDFNGDGKLDIVVQGSSSELDLLPGNGDGTFGAAQIIPTLIGGQDQILSVVAARFNADANLDLAVARSYPTSDGSVTAVEFLMGNGDGTFVSDYRSYGLVTLVNAFAGMAAADINHDGKMDLVGVGFDGSYPTISILPGNGDGTFGATQVSYLEFHTVSSPTSFAIGDFNGDGYLDVAIAGDGNTVGAGYGVDVYLGSRTKK
jgi:hypothetical protein